MIAQPSKLSVDCRYLIYILSHCDRRNHSSIVMRSSELKIFAQGYLCWSYNLGFLHHDTMHVYKSRTSTLVLSLMIRSMACASNSIYQTRSLALLIFLTVFIISFFPFNQSIPGTERLAVSLLKDWTRLGKLSIVHVAEVPNRRLQSPILSINYPDGERQGKY
ncbi:hypothetical protein LENED_003800 [Lentinula edodes]|uniref:Uncharacterized protein n=1 Tax=Lentinula edodes TaxID=5353 RepID=A0A1Q3E4X6_LENED|nr:hypothetical protein LENED_003800 [Lentinula edodes]